MISFIASHFLLYSLLYLVNVLCFIRIFVWKYENTDYNMERWDSDEWAPTIFVSLIPFVGIIVMLVTAFSKFRHYLFIEVKFKWKKKERNYDIENSI